MKQNILDDFLDQLQQVKKLGSLGGVMKLMPGMSKELRQAASQIDDREIARVEAIMRSMTPAERAEPSIIDGSRRVRIARGSGTATQDVNQLLKQHRDMQKLVKGMANGSGMPGMPGLAGMGGMGGMGGLGGLLGSRKQLAALRAMSEGGGADGGLSSLIGGGQSLPSLDTVASGGRQGQGAGTGKAARGAKGKKKKGGRVTPPKGR